MSYTLINSHPSPYGRKVSVALHEKGIPFQVRFDEPWGEDSCTGAHSPLQQLPILITSEGETIFDSTYILEWLEIVHPSPPLLPQGDREKLIALKLKMLGERLMEVAQSLIFEMHRPEPSDAWVTRQSKKIEGGLAAIEGLLDGEPPTSVDPLHLGHIAVASTVLVWEFAVAKGLSPDIPEFRWRQRYPKLNFWVEEISKRRSFRLTEPDMMDVDIAAQMS